MENEQVARIIEDFFRRKKEAPLEKIYKEAVKILGDKINKSSESQELKKQAQKIIDTKKAKEQTSLDNIREKYNELFNLNYQNLVFLSETKSDTLKKIIELDEKYKPSQWINDAAAKASGVVLDVTHIAKLTHSSAKASNINANAHKSELIKPLLVTINCAAKLAVDFAYSTAEYAPIAEFLQLDCEGELLGKVICRNPSVLKPFAKDDDQLMQWQEQINLAFNEKHKSSHILAKQVYFPVNENYHLLAPLTSSAMANIIYDRIWQTRKRDMPVRQARNAELFTKEIDVLFHKTAILKVTQTNHQNVSNLNGKRSGQVILLRSLPPQWKNQIKPPININSIFTKQLGNQAREPFEKLQNLLLAIKFNELSMNLQRKQHITALIADIADVVFDRVAQIHRLKQHIGWSQESKLSAHQQYWLDPFREDEDFQAARINIDWQANIANDFSKWVNKQIKHKQLTLGLAQEKQWKKLFSPLLREFKAVTEVVLEEITIEVKA
jgi:CRISPR-associated protein Csy1